MHKKSAVAIVPMLSVEWVGFPSSHQWSVSCYSPCICQGSCAVVSSAIGNQQKDFAKTPFLKQGKAGRLLQLGHRVFCNEWNNFF